MPFHVLQSASLRSVDEGPVAESEFCMESLGNDGDDDTLGCFYVVNEVGILMGATLIRSYDCFRRQGWMFLSNLLSKTVIASTAGD